MFKGQVLDVDVFRNSIESVSELIEEAKVKIKNEGIVISAIDRAMVAVIDFQIDKKIFESYSIDDDMELGINFLEFVRILKRHGSDENLFIEADMDKIKIRFEGNTKRHFVLPVINISQDDGFDMEKLESGFSSNFSINSNVFNNGIEDAELIGDSVMFELFKDSFKIATSSETSSSNLEVPVGSDLDIKQFQDNIKSKFSIDYMKKIMKARKIIETVDVSMSNDYPMKVVFNVPEKIKLSFVVAHRAQE